MKKIIYLIIVIAITYSCQKAAIDEVPVKNNSVSSVQNVTAKDGRLIFKNKTDFNATIKMLFDNQKGIKDFEAQFPGFTSNKQAFERIDSTFLMSINYNFELISNYAIILETPEGKSLERVIDNQLLAYLFNDEGILQIGDSIFKFSYDFTYKFNVNKLSQLKSAKLDLSSNEVVAYPNIRSKIELQKTKLKSAQASVSEFSLYYTSTKFIKCELNRNITILYNALTVDTKSRKKNFLGIGFAYTVDELYVGFDGYFRIVGGMGEGMDYYFWGEDRKYNGTDVQETIYSCGDGGAPEFVGGRCLGYHGFRYAAGDIFYFLNNTSY